MCFIKSQVLPCKYFLKYRFSLFLKEIFKQNNLFRIYNLIMRVDIQPLRVDDGNCVENINHLVQSFLFQRQNICFYESAV